MIGQLLDRRYHIIQVLGKGEFGETYMARDTSNADHPTCVIKHLKPASNDPLTLEIVKKLFQDEVETLLKLSDRDNLEESLRDRIPRLLTYFEENQEFYLVQEFIEGNSLSQEIQPGKPWTEIQVIELLLEITNILAFMHSHGIIHRDLKPENIIRRSTDQKLVLIDIATINQVCTQIVIENGHITNTLAIDNPSYIAIEQGQGKPRFSSDIYALGMIAIQALTGIYPHQLQQDIHTKEIIWQHFISASPELVEILTTMTRYHFSDRYQNAQELLPVIQKLVNTRPQPINNYPASPEIADLVISEYVVFSDYVVSANNTSSPELVNTAIEPNIPSHLESDQVTITSSSHTSKNINFSKSRRNLNTDSVFLLVFGIIFGGITLCFAIIAYLELTRPAFNLKVNPISLFDPNKGLSFVLNSEKKKTPIKTKQNSKDKTKLNAVASNNKAKNNIKLDSEYAWLATKKVSEKDLQGKTAFDLDIMRNTIYARHGRRFRSRAVQTYFDKQPWYNPKYPFKEFPDSLLSSIEQENLAKIWEYQKRKSLR